MIVLAQELCQERTGFLNRSSRVRKVAFSWRVQPLDTTRLHSLRPHVEGLVPSLMYKRKTAPGSLDMLLWSTNCRHALLVFPFTPLLLPIGCISSAKEVQGTRVRRTWDQAQTPYQRVVATGQLSAEQQTQLQRLYEQTNPLTLREEIYRRLACLWDTESQQPSAA